MKTPRFQSSARLYLPFLLCLFSVYNGSTLAATRSQECDFGSVSRVPTTASAPRRGRTTTVTRPPAPESNSDDWRELIAHTGHRQATGPHFPAAIEHPADDFVSGATREAAAPVARPSVPIPGDFGEVLEIYSGGNLSHTARVRKPSAEEGKKGDEVVVKIIQGGPDREKQIARLKQEYDFLVVLHAKYPNAPFVKALAFHESGAMEMEVLDSTLEKRLKAISGKSSKEILGVFRQIAQALKIMHELGFIHRDLKPGNIGFDRNGNIRLFDLGISGHENVPLTLVSPFSGTPAYMSDGMLHGDAPRREDDMYQAMRVFQEIVAGQVTHRREGTQIVPRLAIAQAPRIRDLRYSPATTDPKRVKEVLSILAWHPFKDAEQLLEAIDMAEQYLDRPGKFFKEYFGPKILENETDIPRLVHEIFTSRELWDRLIAGKLGLSVEKTDAILAEVERIRDLQNARSGLLEASAQDADSSQTRPSPLGPPVSLTPLLVAPFRTNASSLDSDALNAAVAEAQRRAEKAASGTPFSRLTQWPKSLLDLVKKLRPGAIAEPQP